MRKGIKNNLLKRQLVCPRRGTGGVHFKKEDLKNFETVTALIKKVIDATEKK